MLGVSYVMTFYVDACVLVYFQFHPRSVGRSVDPGTASRHFGAETKSLIFEAIHKKTAGSSTLTQRLPDMLTLTHERASISIAEIKI